MGPNKKQISLNGQLITYYQKEGDNHHPLVFLHGWSLNKDSWLPIINKLTTNQTIIVPDFPGFGESSNPPSNWSVSSYGDLIKEFLLKLNLNNPILIGHSFGGRIIIKITSEINNIDKAILIDSAGIKPKTNRLIYLLSKILKPLIILPGGRFLRRKGYQLLGSEDYLATPHLQSVFKNVIAEDLTPLLSKINTPTLIIWGEKDKITPLEDAHKMHKLIKNSELKIIESGTHDCLVKSPGLIANYISDFIS